jgi:ubiquinone/menaquinone biosynthesis C-methylase UbiE
MAKLKQQAKRLMIQLGAISLMNELHFRFCQIWFYRKNKLFKLPLKRFVFPSDRALFYTYKLDHQSYFEDGQLAAQEMIEWGQIHQLKTPIILDWGCGTGRVVRHMPFLQPNIVCYAADTDQMMIEWCKQSIEGVFFDPITANSLPYPSQYFHLVYGISVLTHIPYQETLLWINELHRVLQPNGIAILSTHGTHFFDQINQTEINNLLEQGAFTTAFHQKGHRSMTTYHEQQFFKSLLMPQFDILNYWDGKLYPEKMGGQDCWVIQKKSRLQDATGIKEIS